MNASVHNRITSISNKYDYFSIISVIAMPVGHSMSDVMLCQTTPSLVCLRGVRSDDHTQSHTIVNATLL